MSDRLLIPLIFIFTLFCSFQGYHTDSHGVYSTIDDESDFISRKGSSFANSYLGSNSLGTLGKTIC